MQPGEIKPAQDTEISFGGFYSERENWVSLRKTKYAESSLLYMQFNKISPICTVTLTDCISASLYSSRINDHEVPLLKYTLQYSAKIIYTKVCENKLASTKECKNNSSLRCILQTVTVNKKPFLIDLIDYLG